MDNKEFILSIKTENILMVAGRILQHFTRRRMEAEVVSVVGGRLLVMAKAEEEVMKTTKKLLERIIEVEEVKIFEQSFFI